jgi:ferric-dicitrate binding protein FerR (iron transport regulator)
MHPISQLIIKYNRREITPEETTELLNWVAESPGRQELFASLTEAVPLQEQLKSYMGYEEGPLLERLNRLKKEDMSSGYAPLTEGSRIEGRTNIGDSIEIGTRAGIGGRRRWILAAAAVLLFVVGTGTYLLLLRRPDHTTARQQPVRPVNDVAPGGNKAILTLAGGRRIVLDSAANGLLAEQGMVSVQKLDDGRLAYSPTNEHEKPTDIAYNVLSTPRGGQYNVRLPDGTQVWLNAASSITYPTAFAGKERSVTISGEAYFEVAPDPRKPFLVRVNDLDVKVLGTSFNINGYGDEPGINTTLLQGGVAVSRRGRLVVLKPGQQARATNGPATVNGGLSVSKAVDIEQVMAWKNGLFKFSGTSLSEIMRQVQRWYDVDVVYEGGMEKMTFSGGMPRREYVSQVLKMLEETGGAHFTIEGRTIKITP